jgi:D-alanine-D-alanine ligase-like ATP-grasp enzyme
VLDPLAEYESTAIQGFLRALGVEWGRLDLLRDKDGKLWFLEFNANGQFGFLDEIDRAGLISSIAKYLG